MSEYYIDPKNLHLGGYRVGGDEATYFPELYTWAVNELGIESVIDLGCGEGQTLNFFETLLPGSVWGIDGVPQKQPNIFCHDFTKGRFGPSPHYLSEFDLCWCVEFVEHINEEFMPNFLDVFKRARMVFITHAFPGQAGHHHTNCQDASYWKGAMAAIGYRLDELLTAQAKAKAAFNPSPWNHFCRSGMCFIRY